MDTLRDKQEVPRAGSGNGVTAFIQGGQAAFQTSILAIFAAQAGAYDTAIDAATSASFCSKSVLFSFLGDQQNAFSLALQAAQFAIKVPLPSLYRL